MTNKEFIEKLRQAKKLAMEKYSDRWRVWSACHDVGLIAWNSFSEPWDVYINGSAAFLAEQGNTAENVARVFDESIKALGGKP